MKLSIGIMVLSIILMASLAIFAQDDQAAQNFIKKGKDSLNLGKFSEALIFFNNATLEDQSLWQPFYYRGITLYKLNRYDEALVAFNESINRNSSIAILWFQKGLTLIKLSRNDEARASLENATELDPNFEDAWYNLGLTWSKLNNSNQAIRAYEEVIKLNKSNDDAWYNKGIIHQKLNRCEKALEAYGNINKGPLYKDALWRKGEILQRLTGREHEGHYYKGLSQYERGRNQEALAHLNKSLEINPNYSQAWFAKGLVLMELKDIEDALNAFNKTSEINESFAEAHYYKGILFGKKSDHQNALKSFDQTINALIEQGNEKTPLAADAWYYRGVALRKLGRDDEAFSSFNFLNSSEGIKEKDADYWVRKGEQLGNKGWHDAALIALSNATSISDNDAKAWYNFGLAYYGLERYDEAASSLNKAVYIILEDEATANKVLLEKAYINLAAALANLNRGDEALEAIQEAIDLNDSSIQAWYTKGSILVKLNRSEEANQSFSQAIKLDPSNVNAWYGLAKTEALAGKYKEALKSYEMAIDRKRYYDQAWIDKGEIHKVLNQDGEALVSFNMAIDAINYSEAMLFCDKGYALRVSGRDLEALDAFTKSLDIDPLNAAAWYNKSIVLAKLSNSTEANKAIERAALIRPTYKDTAEFWFARGNIFLNLNRSEDALKAFNESLKRNALYQDALNGKYLALIKLGKEAEAKKYVDQLCCNNSIQNSFSEGPTNKDVDLFDEDIRKNRQKLAYAWDGKADALYKLGFTEKALQSYAQAKRWSSEGIYESVFPVILLIFYFISFIVTILAFRRKSIMRILIGVNSASLLAFVAVIAEFFDNSRAFWSLLVIIVIQLLALLFLILLGYRNSIWWEMAKLAFDDFSVYNNGLNNFSLALCILCTILSIISISYLIIPWVSLGPSLLQTLSYFMLFLLTIVILATCIPMVKMLTSKFVSRDLRKILAVEQFAYLSCCAVPLSWILWSFGFSSGMYWRSTIEDIPLRIPVSTAVLLILFTFGFVIPYYYGYLNNKAWTNDLRAQEKIWIGEAIELTNEIVRKEKDQMGVNIGEYTDNFNRMKSEIHENIRSIFNNTDSLCRNYKECNFNPESIFNYIYTTMKKNDQLWKKSGSSYYQNVSKIIENKFKLLDEPQLRHVNLSMTALVILEEQNSRESIQKKFLRIYGELKAMVENWTELDNQDKTKMWANFITVFITPLLPLLLSVFAPWMGLPIDQGSLVKLVADASSQYTFGF